MTPQIPTIVLIILLMIIIWTIIWKGLALWKAARSGSRAWFIILLIINTLGILEILYIFIFSKIGKKHKIEEKKN
jgi:hypothetical protein